MKIYLDYAAATPVAVEVKQAMDKYLDEDYFNPSATYLAAQKVKSELAQARKTIAHWLGAKSNEIVFTAGATESDNLAIQGVMDKFPDANVIISAVEHEAVVEASANYEHKIAPVDQQGRLLTSDLKELIDDKTALISVIYANNEIGTIQSLPEVAGIITAVRADRRQRNIDQPIYLHTDAVQAANYLDLHVSKLGVDLLTLSAAKIYGPKQVGCLYVRSGVEIEPLIYGGGQERSLRGGTENVAGVVGFATALELVQTQRREEGKRVGELRDRLSNNLLENIEGSQVAGTTKKRLPNNLNIHFPDVDGERLVMELDEMGVMVATGAACDASSDEPSHVLLALGLNEETARSSLRISLGQGSNASNIDSAAEAIVDAISRLRQN